MIDRQSLRHAAWEAFAHAYHKAEPNSSGINPFGYVGGLDAVLDAVADWLRERAKVYVGSEVARGGREALESAADAMSSARVSP
jgi:hypothetical protein